MELRITRRDAVVCTVIVLLFSAWLVYAINDNRVMRLELEQLAAAHLDDWFDGSHEGAIRSNHDYLAIIDSEKAFTLFGRGWGVVHIYTRKKDDESFGSFSGVEYFYMREKGAWILTDSAGCGALEHHVRAFDEFMQLGVDVPNRVYERALGIDFAYGMDHLKAQRAANRADESDNFHAE